MRSAQMGRTDPQGPAGRRKGSALFSKLSVQEGGPSSPRVTLAASDSGLRPRLA